MNDTAQNILLVTVSTALVAVLLYVGLHTSSSPKFFPTELKQVQDDFDIHYVENNTGNPDYHPTYANSK